MKKLIFAALLCAMGFIANAADIVNNSRCTIIVTPICYNPVSCVTSVCTGASVTVPAGGVAVLPVCLCSSTIDLQGYSVCLVSSSTTCHACGTIGAATGPYPCTDFQSTLFLNCPACGTVSTGVSVSWTSAGNMLVH